MTIQELKEAAAQMGVAVVDASKRTFGRVAAVVAQDAIPGSHRGIAVAVNGVGVEATTVDMGGGHTDRNPVLQFDIDNTQAGAINEIVRVGGMAGLADNYVRLGIDPSAADSVHGISDGFGVNVQMCQGFSMITQSSPVFIREIKIISDDTTQLNKQFTHFAIMPDFTVIPLKQNIAFTREKTDQAVDLLVARGSWLLGPRHYLEFQSVRAKSVQILLEISSIAEIKQFALF